MILVQEYQMSNGVPLYELLTIAYSLTFRHSCRRSGKKEGRSAKPRIKLVVSRVGLILPHQSLYIHR